MPESLSKDAETVIIEEGGMSVEDYRETIDKFEQSHLDMETFRTLGAMVSGNPTVVKQVKAVEIRKVRTPTDHLACYW